MNSEIMKTEAANTITEWRQKHNGPCMLEIQNGEVIARKPTTSCYQIKKDLYISTWHQQNGFDGAQWTAIGTTLFNLYCKEKAFHEHQKH